MSGRPTLTQFPCLVPGCREVFGTQDELDLHGCSAPISDYWTSVSAFTMTDSRSGPRFGSAPSARSGNMQSDRPRGAARGARGSSSRSRVMGVLPSAPTLSLSCPDPSCSSRPFSSVPRLIKHTWQGHDTSQRAQFRFYPEALTASRLFLCEDCYTCDAATARWRHLCDSGELGAAQALRDHIADLDVAEAEEQAYWDARDALPPARAGRH